MQIKKNVIILFLVIISVQIFCQENKSKEQGNRISIIQRIDNEVQLTDEQKTFLKAFIDNEKLKIKAKPVEERKKLYTVMRKKIEQKLDSILTDEQKQKIILNREQRDIDAINNLNKKTN